MEKLTLNFDCSIFYGEDLTDYLKSLKGINLIKIDKNNLDIHVEYDSNIISLKVLKYEILYCLNLLKNPSIIAFNKHFSSAVSKKTIIIKDLCCEYCLKGMIEDLLEINGINSAHTNFDFITKKDVNIYVTYDEEKISLEKINEIEVDFNKR